MRDQCAQPLILFAAVLARSGAAQTSDTNRLPADTVELSEAAHRDSRRVGELPANERYPTAAEIRHIR